MKINEDNRVCNLIAKCLAYGRKAGIVSDNDNIACLDLLMRKDTSWSPGEDFLDTLEPEEPTLTWGDVQLIDTFILECAREEREGKDWGESEEFYTEVLRRYNDFTKRTILEIVSKIHEYNESDRKDSPRD